MNPIVIPGAKEQKILIELGMKKLFKEANYLPLPSPPTPPKEI